MQGPPQQSHRTPRPLPALIAPRTPKPPAASPALSDDLEPAKLHPAAHIPLADLRNPPLPPSSPDLEAAGADEPPTWSQRCLKAVKRHAAFVGPGVIASVAYLDPGNWATDLQAGSQFGYGHLFIILFAGLIALLFQILSTRLGCVSDYDLATHCRFALYDRDSPYKLVYRYALLYPLYVIAEIGIIMTDLAELLGSAIAINLLIPAIPLWAAVLLTSLDVLLILIIFNYPQRTVSTSMRLFELLIGLLVLCVLASFVALLVKVGPVWKDVFYGYVPGPRLVNGGGIYIAVGIVGATVMPHAFYIGSKMATMRRLKPEDYGEVSDPSASSRDSDDGDSEAGSEDRKPPRTAAERARRFFRRASTVGERGRGATSTSYLPSLHLPQPVSLGNLGLDLPALTRKRGESPVRERRDEIVEEDVGCVEEEGEEDAKVDERETGAPVSSAQSPPRKTLASASPQSSSSRPRRKPTLACVRAHLTHASLDVAGSLLGFAVVVNSCILILGAAVFYYGDGRSSNQDGEGVSDLFDAYELVKQYLGQAFAYLFAVALLAAGQSASLTVTLSGQIVSEGFINWRTKPWKRRLITRCIGIIPSFSVAIAVGREGIDTLLVASQVALSIVLTFVLLPLIIFCAQHSIMSVPLDPTAPVPSPVPSTDRTASPSTRQRLAALVRTLNPFRHRSTPPGTVSFASPVWLVWLCGALWLLIGIANVYALYDVDHNGA
ncbi:hypothetical protein Rhopal_000970-T1 [Rhodotorula paludigena]|uniref:Uncharacterized protein n=1 Tax=Rhodotorula paludigena TaxID=86838 RepID=A0AAV5GC29_9BASI|nr:hypothetical protein Rhopal_000970-T1 [Rhodotorula paludigena]